MSDTKAYLSKLFKPGDGLCYTSLDKGTAVVPFEEALELRPARNFVSVNPLLINEDRMPTADWHNAGVGRRADVNVSAYRNFLLEFDEDSLAEQLFEVRSKELPFATLTFSGGKSLHAVVALTESVGSPAAYAHVHKCLRYIFWRTDPTCRNPSRLTRVAGARRLCDDGPEREQELYELRKPIKVDQLERYINRFRSHIYRCMDREQEEQHKRVRDIEARGGGGLLAVDPKTMAFLESGETPAKSRHARLVAAAFELMECGVDYVEALRLLEKAADLAGITADPKRAREAEQVANYVYARAAR